MTSLTPARPRPRARTALVSAAALLTLTAAAGCDSGEDIEGERDRPSSADAGTEVPTVETETTLQNVGNKLDDVHRERLKASITAVVDPYFDEAFLGEFPRSDFAPAFAAFTPGAAEDAQRDLALLSNASIADQIEGATATKRRVRADVLAVDGHPRGATAHFVLEFSTEGQLEQSLRVRGDLYLAKDKGEWRVFGYDVEQAEQL